MNDWLEETSTYTSAPEFADLFFAGPQPDAACTFGAASHMGKVRRQNEDHFAVLRRRRSTDLLLGSLPPDELSSPETCAYALVVADGMGGMKSGELASRMAIRTMLELAGHATSWVMRLTDPDSQQIQERVQAYVRRVHAALCEYSRRNEASHDMGTTWTSAHLFGRQAVIVHLGDSRAYLFRDGELCQLTHDQTLAQTLIDRGLDPEHVGKFRHVLLNSLGAGNDEPAATVHHLELLPGDRLLLCTDGLSDMVADPDIADALARHAEPQAACDALVVRALANGGKDNVTAVLAAVDTEHDRRDSPASATSSPSTAAQGRG